MHTRIPKGYRLLTDDEIRAERHDPGHLRELCTCGHLDTQHARRHNHNPCGRCACPCFTWAAYVTRRKP